MLRKFIKKISSKFNYKYTFCKLIDQNRQKKFNIWNFFLSISILSLVFVIYVFARVSVELPEYEKLSEYSPSVISRFYAGDGTLLVEYAEENRIFVEYDQLPANLIKIKN